MVARPLRAGDAAALPRRRSRSPAWLVADVARRHHGRRPGRDRLPPQPARRCASATAAARSTASRLAGDRPLRAMTALQEARLQSARGRPEPALEALRGARVAARLADHAGDPGPDRRTRGARSLAALGERRGGRRSLTGDSEEAAVGPRAAAPARRRRGRGAHAMVEPCLTSPVALRPTRHSRRGWSRRVAAMRSATRPAPAPRSSRRWTPPSWAGSGAPFLHARRVDRAAAAPPPRATGRATGRCSTSWWPRVDRPAARRPVATLRRRAVGARGGGAALPADDDVQPGDRRRAVRLGQHRQDPPEGDLPQARRRRTGASAVRRARELSLIGPP